MLDTSKLSLFVIAVLALVVTPGPAVLYIVARSTEQGWKAGLASVLGIEFATLVHVAAAALGFSAIVLATPLAFDFVKYLSVAYLGVFGLRKLVARPGCAAAHTAGRDTLRLIFAQGALLELMNPQTGLFFVGFLPQFVTPRLGSVPIQFLTLGLVFVTIAILAEGTYALLAGTLARSWRGSCRWQRVQQLVYGSVYVGLGTLAALA